MLAHTAQLQLPEWLVQRLPQLTATYATIEQRMELAIDLARQNVEQKSGGPFGAAIFDQSNGWLLGVGVNSVERCQASIAHAEIMAISMTQNQLQTFDLGAGERALQLVSSAEPCAMCLAAIPWSGVKEVVCAARDEDVRAIGFDEGFKPIGWQENLAQASISARADVLRDQAVLVLQQYAAAGGTIYNP